MAFSTLLIISLAVIVGVPSADGLGDGGLDLVPRGGGCCDCVFSTEDKHTCEADSGTNWVAGPEGTHSGWVDGYCTDHGHTNENCSVGEEEDEAPLLAALWTALDAGDVEAVGDFFSENREWIAFNRDRAAVQGLNCRRDSYRFHFPLDPEEVRIVEQSLQ